MMIDERVDPLCQPHWRVRWHGPFPSPPLDEDVPVPEARAALLLLGQRHKLDTGHEDGESGHIAIVVWVLFGGE